MASETKASRELDALIAEKVMGWTRPKEAIPDGWCLPTYGVPWERREYRGPAPPLTEPWEHVVVETATAEQMAERFYWRSPAGCYHKPESYFDTPEIDYSSDIGAAWEVVAKLKELKRAAFVLGSSGCSDQFSAWFFDGVWGLGRSQNSVPEYGDPRLLGVGSADTAPLAICLAAIKTLRFEVPA